MSLTDFPSASAPVIALDIGGTSIRAAAVTLGPEPEVRNRVRTATLAPQGGVAVLQRALELAASVHQQVPGAEGVGIASAGVIGPETGRVTSATQLIPEWTGTEVGRVMSERLRLPSTVLNDVHAHGVGEFSFGQGLGCSSALVAAVGTGLGGALFSNNDLIRGTTGHAGHIGHIHHAAAEGLDCSCNRTGHLEAVASGSGMTQQYAKQKSPSDPVAADAAAVAELASSGVAAAEQVIATAGAALGESLGSLANAWDPERIILTGSVTGAGPLWWQQVVSGYRASAMNNMQDRPLRCGTLGDDAPLLGVAAAHLRSVQTSSRRPVSGHGFGTQDIRHTE